MRQSRGRGSSFPVSASFDRACCGEFTGAWRGDTVTGWLPFLSERQRQRRSILRGRKRGRDRGGETEREKEGHSILGEERQREKEIEEEREGERGENGRCEVGKHSNYILNPVLQEVSASRQ